MSHIKNPYRRPTIPAMVGTALEYYNESLYAFMAPLMVSLFFPMLEPLWGLIIAFAMYPLSALIRPFGAYIMGNIGDRFGRKKALIISIMWMAIVTTCIGFLPTYAMVGWLAPILLFSLRLLQHFFVAGEYNGGAIYVLEFTKRSEHGWISGVYCAFTVSGIALAGVISALIINYHPSAWRIPYLMGALIGIIGLIMRVMCEETPEFSNAPSIRTRLTFTQMLKDHRTALLYATSIASFFSALYCVPAILLHSYIPLITPIPKETMIWITVYMHGIYLGALLLGGKLADILGIAYSMLLACVSIVFLSYPLISLLNIGTIPAIIIMQTIFALLCGWYIGPFHAYVQSLFPVEVRYRCISLSYSVGAQLGGIVPSLGLFLWHTTNHMATPAFILMIWGTFAIMMHVFQLRKGTDPLCMTSAL